MANTAPHTFVVARAEDVPTLSKFKFPGFTAFWEDKTKTLLLESENPCKPEEWKLDEPFSSLRDALEKNDFVIRRERRHIFFLHIEAAANRSDCCRFCGQIITSKSGQNCGLHNNGEKA